MELLERSKVGRDINRHYYTNEEVVSALKQPLVQRLIDLIRLRNSHAAFNGEFSIEVPEKDLLIMKWAKGVHWVTLNVDLSSVKAIITGSGLDKEYRYAG